MNRLTPEKASELLDRLERSVVEYERATGPQVANVRREAAEARKALFQALTGASDA